MPHEGFSARSKPQTHLGFELPFRNPPRPNSGGPNGKEKSNMPCKLPSTGLIHLGSILVAKARHRANHLPGRKPNVPLGISLIYPLYSSPSSLCTPYVPFYVLPALEIPSVVGSNFASCEGEELSWLVCADLGP